MRVTATPLMMRAFSLSLPAAAAHETVGPHCTHHTMECASAIKNAANLGARLTAPGKTPAMKRLIVLFSPVSGNAARGQWI